MAKIEDVRSGDQIMVDGRWRRVHGVSQGRGRTVIVNRDGNSADEWIPGAEVRVR